jgi:hypothetical protein
VKPSTAAVLALLRQRGEQGLTPIESLEDHLKDRTIKFRRVTVERIVADDWEYPIPVQTGPGLFDAAAEAELDGLL